MNTTWLGSPNRTDVGRAPGDVRGVVVHDTECDLHATTATFQRTGGASAHYAIDTDGRCYQYVAEPSVAYHVAAWGNDYSLDRNRPDWLPAYNGRYSAVNAATIGIELVGYAAQGYTPAQYASLGALIVDICQRWGITPTLLPDVGPAATVVTHGWLQTDRSDPGLLFDWQQLRAALSPQTQEADVPLSAEDQRILETVHSLGANADSIVGWINLIGALEAQLNQRQQPTPVLEKVASVTLQYEDGSTQTIAASSDGTISAN